MASTYSALKIELLETGANSGTWGAATNVNLGDDILGEAITGSATVNFASDADVTITLTDSSTSQSARNLRLNITESSTGVGSVRNLILGSGCQIEKFYLINNTGTGAKTVKNTSGTGISVPAGKATLVFNNGTNVVDAASYFTSLTLGSALPVASGGTGLTAGTSGGVLAYTASGTLASSGALTASALVLGGGAGAAPATTTTGTGVVTALGVNTGTAGAFVVNGGALGTPSSGTLTLATGLPLSSGVTGILPIANGGTATATPSLVQGSNITITGTWPNQTIAAAAPGTGTVTSVSGTGTVNGISLSGTVTSSGNLTLGGTLSGVSLTSQVTGTLPIANGGTGTTSTTFANLTTNVTGTLPVNNGGTGASTLTANNVVLGNGTSAVQFVAPSTSGNVLTSNGTTWSSTAPAGAGSLVFLSTVTASNSATISVENTFDSTYDVYLIVISGLTLSVNGAIRVTFKMGGTYDTSSNYSRFAFVGNSNTTTAPNGAEEANTDFVLGSCGSTASRNFNATMRIFVPSSTSLVKFCTWESSAYTDTVDRIQSINGSAMNKLTSALTGVRFTPGSGDFVSGSFRLYGIKKS